MTPKNVRVFFFYREEYVAEQLRLRRLKEAGRGDLLAEAQKPSKKGAERKETLHDELYQIPDKYRVRSILTRFVAQCVDVCTSLLI